MPAARLRPHRDGLAPPPDSARGQRSEQQVAQRAAVDLGPPAGPVVLLREVDRAVGPEQPQGLPAGVDQLLELLGQLGGAQGELSGVVVDVEHPALGPDVRAGLQVEDGGVEAVDVQHPGEGEPAEAAADDREGVVGGDGHGEATPLLSSGLPPR